MNSGWEKLVFNIIIMQINIFVFWSSIVRWAFDPTWGWCDRLKMDYEEYMYNQVREWWIIRPYEYIYVYNLWIDWNTSRDVLNRFDKEFSDRANKWYTDREENIFIFDIWKNDISMLDINESLECIGKLIKKAVGISDNVLFVLSSPICKNKMMMVEWLNDIVYLFYGMWDKIKKVQDLLENEGIKYINLYNEWANIDYSDYLADWLHPNEKWHTYIYERVKEYLDGVVLKLTNKDI